MTLEKNHHFILSDIHGMYSHFTSILEKFNPENHNLVILGDLVDRGLHSLEVITACMNLQKAYPNQVLILKGNHEDMFLNFLEHPDTETGDWYFNNGGYQTCTSFLNNEYVKIQSYEKIAESILSKRKEEVQFLNNLPLYHETDHIIFVHAGVNLRMEDWRNGSEKDFLWSRDMKYSKNTTSKKIVFGHTPTRTLHQNASDDIWLSLDKTMIGIDGAAAYGGQLNTVIMDSNANIVTTYFHK
ncbi:serine/threonine protein phosphatase [Bacillus phage vB_BauM_KLEB27-3]|nr:serine/threonine protein phosphatase [Bacillus phage vB_BauM_KLEB27-3]